MPTLIPVDYDPFADDAPSQPAPRKPRLIPVDYDPFDGNPPPELAEPKRTWGEAITDTGKAVVLKGGANLLRTGYNIADQMSGGFLNKDIRDLTGYDVDAKLGELQQAAADTQSAGFKAKEQRIQDLKKREGTLAALMGAASDPGYLVDQVASSLPMMLGIAAGARAGASAGARNASAAGLEGNAARQAENAMAARYAAGTEGVMEGADSRYSAKDRVSQLSDEQLHQSPEYWDLIQQGATPEEARYELGVKAGNTAFAITAPIAAVAGKLTGASGIEANILRGQRAGAGVGRTLASEAGQEFIQEGSNQFGQNVGIQDFADPNQALSEDVLFNASLGAMTGAVQGGGIKIADRVIQGARGVASNEAIPEPINTPGSDNTSPPPPTPEPNPPDDGQGGAPDAAGFEDGPLPPLMDEGPEQGIPPQQAAAPKPWDRPDAGPMTRAVGAGVKAGTLADPTAPQVSGPLTGALEGELLPPQDSLGQDRPTVERGQTLDGEAVDMSNTRSIDAPPAPLTGDVLPPESSVQPRTGQPGIDRAPLDGDYSALGQPLPGPQRRLPPPADDAPFEALPAMPNGGPGTGPFGAGPASASPLLAPPETGQTDKRPKWQDLNDRQQPIPKGQAQMLAGFARQQTGTPHQVVPHPEVPGSYTVAAPLAPPGELSTGAEASAPQASPENHHEKSAADFVKWATADAKRRYGYEAASPEDAAQNDAEFRKQHADWIEAAIEQGKPVSAAALAEHADLAANYPELYPLLAKASQWNAQASEPHPPTEISNGSNNPAPVGPRRDPQQRGNAQGSYGDIGDRPSLEPGGSGDAPASARRDPAPAPVGIARSEPDPAVNPTRPTAPTFRFQDGKLHTDAPAHSITTAKGKTKNGVLVPFKTLTPAQVKSVYGVVRKDGIFVSDSNIQRLEAQQLPAATQVTRLAAQGVPSPYELPRGQQIGDAAAIRALHDEVRDGGLAADQKKAVRYLDIADDQAAAIKQATGLDVSGMAHTVDSFAMRHAHKQHGNPQSEALRGQGAVTAEDWAKIPEIVSQYDEVKHAGKDKAGNDLLQYRKRYNGTTYFVEEVRNKRGELAAKTLWKTRTAIADAPQKTAPTLTSETLGHPSPQGKNTLPDAGDGVKSASGTFGFEIQKSIETEMSAQDTALPHSAVKAEGSHASGADRVSTDALLSGAKRDSDGQAFAADDAKPLASRNKSTTGQSASTLRTSINKLLSGWKNAPKVNVVQSVDDLPAPLRAKLAQSDALDDVEGFYDPKTQQVWLVADHLPTAERAAFVALHEIAGHHGLRGLFGDRLKPLMLDIYRSNAAIRQAADRLMERYGYSRELATEEVLADMAGSGQGANQTVLQRVIRAMRNWLRNAGLKLALSDADITGLLADARKYVREAVEKPQRGRRLDDRNRMQESLATSRNNDPGEGDEAMIELLPLEESDDDIKARAALFLSSLDEGTIIYGRESDGTRRKSPLTERIRESSKRAAHELRGAAETERVSKSPLAGFSEYTITGEVAKPNPLLAEEHLLVKVYGKEQVEQGLGDEPALTFVIQKDGEITVNGPDPWSNTFREFQQRGWADYATGKNGEPQRQWSILTDPARPGKRLPIAQLLPLIGDVHARVKEWRFEPDVGLKWGRVTGATGMFDTATGETGRAGALYFSRSGQLDLSSPAQFRSLWRTATDKVADFLASPKTLNVWNRTVGTQYDAAMKDEHFRPVFQAGQNYLSDTARLAMAAESQAPTLLPKIGDMRDLIRNGGEAFRRGRSKDLQVVAKALFEGTLYQSPNGSEEGRVWTDGQLRERYRMTEVQVRLYQEGRASIDESLDGLARSALYQLLRSASIDPALVTGDAFKDAPLDTLREVMGDELKAASRHLEHLVQSDPANARQHQSKLDAVNDLRERVTDILDKTETLKAKGYAPLMRFGEYTLEVTLPDGERIFRLFESRYELNQEARRLRQAVPGAEVKLGVLDEDSHKLFKGTSPESLLLFAKELGLDKDAATQEVLQKAVANRSALKRLIHRQGIAGFDDNITRVLAAFILSNARRSSSQYNMATMQEAIQAIPKGKGDVMKKSVALMQYLVEPKEEAAALRSLMFVNFLGGSLAAAAVNLTQPLMMTFPYLAQSLGGPRAAALLAQAAKDVYRKDFGPNEKHLQQALVRAERAGIVAPQDIHQLMAEANTRNKGWRAVMAVWGAPFAEAETINRRMTFIAAYRGAQEKGEADPYAAAVRAVTETQGLYNRGNRPEWARGALGASAFTFKQYSIAYVEMFNRMDRTGKLYALAILLMLGGVEGLPFSQDVEDLIDTLGRWLGFATTSSKTLHDTVARAVGKHLADYLTRGVSVGTGVDVSGRLGLGNIIPGTRLFTPMESPESRMKQVGELVGPTAGLVSQAGDALDNIAAGRVGSGILAASPKAIRDVFKGAEMGATGEYKDIKGRKVIDTDRVDAIIKGIGFQPQKVAKVQRDMGRVQASNALQRQVESSIADDWAQALAAKDSAGAKAAKQRLADWNRKNPDTPIRITPGQVFSRVKAMKQSKEQRVMKATPRELRQPL